MPGISIICGDNEIMDNAFGRLNKVIRAMMHYDFYEYNEIIKNEFIYIGLTGYSGYPYKVWRENNILILMEGLVYNLNSTEIEINLSNIAYEFQIKGDYLKHIKDWSKKADGEYLIVLVNLEKKEIIAFNDPLARLTTYIYSDNKRILLSRELKFFSGLIPKLQYDRQCIAEMLYFGHTIGLKTLLKDVSFVQAGTLIQIDLKTFETKLTDIVHYNFDVETNATKPIIQVAEELQNLYIENSINLKNFFSKYKHAVSLSGGIDSRVVLAGLAKAGADVIGVTFQDADTIMRGADAIYAEKVAKALNVKWELFDLEKEDLAEANKLISMKDGMNFIGISYILPFLKNILELFGPNVVYHTAVVDDLALKDQSPPKKITSFRSLINLIINRYGKFQLNEIELLTGVRAKEFIENVSRTIETYPEKNFNRKYIHYRIFERLFNYNFHGEDRNRYLLWSSSPFASYRIFNYAMNIPPSYKRYFKLYIKFFEFLEPICLDIKYANWNAPLKSYKRYFNPIAYKLYSNLPGTIRRMIQKKTMYKGINIDPKIIIYVNSCIKQCSTVLDYFSEDALKTLISKGCTKYNFDNIATIVGYIAFNENYRKQMI